VVHVEFQPPLRPASSVPHWDEEEARNEDVQGVRSHLVPVWSTSTPFLLCRRSRTSFGHRPESCLSTREIPEAGASFFYGEDLAATFRRTAGYVDKILKGAQPADFFVEQPPSSSWSSP
jgi:hypothetical protein